jgi:hypothetical protein
MGVADRQNTLFQNNQQKSLSAFQKQQQDIRDHRRARSEYDQRQSELHFNEL